jgi:hypothetical protein
VAVKVTPIRWAIVLGDKKNKRAFDNVAIIGVDLSPDGASIAYSLNGDAPLYMLSGF